MVDTLKKYLPLAVILLLASVARFYQYDAWSLSNDELSAISRLRFDSFSELIKGGVEVDGHPAAVQVMLYYWSKLFGISAAAIRLPFVVSGILSVLMGYLIARRWFGETPAIFSGVAMALLQFPVLYSQLARPYITGLLFVLIAVYCWDSLLFRTRKKWRMASLLGVSYALAMYTHYFSFLTVLILGITGLFYLKKESRWPYIASGGIAVLLFLPHVPITLQHLSYGGVGEWLAKPSPGWILYHMVYIFNQSGFLLFASVSVVIAALLYDNSIRRWNRYHTISFVLFFGVFLVGFAYSQLVNAVLQHSTMIFVFPFFLFLIFSWLGWNQVSKYLVYLFALFMVISPNGLSGFYNKQHFGEFKEVAKKYVEWNKKYGPSSISNILIANDPYYIRYYFQEDSVRLDKILYGDEGDRDELAEFMAKSGKPMTCFAWTKPINHQVYDVIRGYYPLVKADRSYRDLSRISLFAKKEGKPYDSLFRNNKHKLVLTVTDFNANGTSLKFKQDHIIDTAGWRCYRVKSGRKFDLEYTGTYPFGSKAFKELQIEAEVFANKPLEEAMWVAAVFNKEGDQVLWKGIPLAYFTKNPGKWQKLIFTPDMEKLADKQHTIKVYIWNRGNETFLVDKMSIAAYE